MGRSRVVNAVGTAGEDDAVGLERLQLLNGSGVAFDFAVNAALADSSGDELVILTAEVENDAKLVCHTEPPVSPRRHAEVVE